MLSAPTPSNESARLQALRELLILDTPPEQRFDRVVEFAREEFEVPIVLLSLIDGERQWFKARTGLDACETGRDISFCGHAILQPALFVVPDARLDPRFADNPLVTGPPHIRFYAGAPLEVAPGLRVGTLCLISPQPRAFDATDQAILGVLRDLVVGELRERAEAGA
ncbi:MAG: GAF domain-containing protein [Pelomonas sp.]|nr:GAF domain-containing protein [Roseateles sp.]